MRTHFNSVDEYIAEQPPAAQSVLGRVRSTIRKALPKAEEVISYQIPVYKLNGERVIFFAAWKQHYSIYPGHGRFVEEYKDQLRPYKVSKGTIQFPLADPVPVKLIQTIVKTRAREVAERARQKKVASKRG